MKKKVAAATVLILLACIIFYAFDSSRGRKDGTVYPTAGFPQWLKTFARINPEAYSVDALKSILLKNANIASISADVAFLSVFTLIIMTTAMLTFKRTL